MREIIAVCRSGKKSRDRTARVLDQYFWRIGDRTWRGKATNACLDRVARELRSNATRNTAVTIQEVRSANEKATNFFEERNKMEDQVGSLQTAHYMAQNQLQHLQV